MGSSNVVPRSASKHHKNRHQLGLLILGTFRNLQNDFTQVDEDSIVVKVGKTLDKLIRLQDVLLKL